MVKIVNNNPKFLKNVRRIEIILSSRSTGIDSEWFIAGLPSSMLDKIKTNDGMITINDGNRDLNNNFMLLWV